jgi:subtilisin family serine protease
LSEITDDGLFHFKISSQNSNNNGDDDFEYDGLMKLHSNGKQKRRFKRQVKTRIDKLEQDDRVEFVLPQYILSRFKRHHYEDDEYEEEEDEDSNRLERFIEMIDYFEKNDLKRQLDSESNIIPSLDEIINDDSINFNDEKFNEEWYLINNGQLNTPPNCDINVKQAWLNGFTGKNITIVIVDDGLDHEHPDFEGKYVNNN